MKKILTIIRDRVAGMRDDNGRHTRYGLCSIADHLRTGGDLTHGELHSFMLYLSEYVRMSGNDLWEYRAGFLHSNTREYSPNTWVWNPHDKQVRIDWLNEHIKLNS